MQHDNQNTLTDAATRQLALASSFRRGFSAEPINYTPLPGMSVPGGITQQVSAWPVKVTGDALTSPPEAVGLHPAKLYCPSPFTAGQWDEFDCWARAMPDQTLKTGDIGLGRVIGWEAQPPTSGGTPSERPVYTLQAKSATEGTGPRGKPGLTIPGRDGLDGRMGPPAPRTERIRCWKDPVLVATMAPVTLASLTVGATVNGVTLAAGNRILVNAQSTGSENGIYTVSATGAPVRAIDAIAGAHLLGATVAVLRGTVGADTIWLCTSDPTITIGLTATTWAQVGAMAVSPWKEPVRCRTATALPANTYSNGSSGVGATLTATANGSLNFAASVDVTSLTAGDSLLVANESSSANNGIYVVTQVGSVSTPYILTRRTDADTGAKLNGATVFVQVGNTYFDSEWTCTTDPGITVGTSPIVWREKPFSSAVTSADNSLARWDGAGASKLQGSLTFVDDNGQFSTQYTTGGITRSWSTYWLGAYESRIQVGGDLNNYVSIGASHSAAVNPPASVLLSSSNGTIVRLFSISLTAGFDVLAFMPFDKKFRLLPTSHGPSDTVTCGFSVQRGYGPGAVNHDGIDATCTVTVGGASKTMTITGGIVTDIS